MSVVFLSACQRNKAIPVPPSHLALVGSWSSGNNFFRLGRDGAVDLELNGPDLSLLVRKGNLRSIKGTDLEVGVGEWQPSTHLTISESPYLSPKGDAIRVQGIELYRTEAEAPAA